MGYLEGGRYSAPLLRVLKRKGVDTDQMSILIIKLKNNNEKEKKGQGHGRRRDTNILCNVRYEISDFLLSNGKGKFLSDIHWLKWFPG